MKFAVVSAWPDLKNAEYEVIERIKISAKNIGSECIVIDNEGFVIGEDDKRTGICYSGGEVEFAIALHFTSEKLYNIYTYGAMWNPPKFLMDFGYETESQKYYTYDDYLVYGSRKIEAHLENLLVPTNKDITNCLHFMTSVPGKIYKPKLTDNIKLFYSGINWERLSNSKGRHHDLFKALDDERLTKIYGPEIFFDAVPWAGFHTYAGSLPFDGLSTIKAINECGVSLVMTSNEHRKVEAVSSRLFESCAAGAILICDDNPFIMREFGDSVLYINYDLNNYQKNVEQIKEHLNWIKNNKEEALTLAKRSQLIYQEKYHLDNVLETLIDKHEFRKQEVIDYTCDLKTEVSVILRVLNITSELKESIKSLNTQYNKNSIELLIVCDKNNADELIEFLKINLCKNIIYKIIPLNMFQNKNRIITTGEMLVEGIFCAKNEHIFILDEGRILFDEHLSLLVRQFEKDTVSMSYSSYNYYNTKADGTLERSKKSFSNYHISDIISFSEYIEISMLMFKKSSLNNYHSLLKLLDGKESYSIMIACFLVGDWKFVYKNSFSIIQKESKIYNPLKEQIVEDNWQLQYIRDAFKYNQILSNYTKQNVHHLDLVTVDLNQFETLLKNFIKSKIKAKYPRSLRFLKKIYNKVIK